MIHPLLGLLILVAFAIGLRWFLRRAYPKRLPVAQPSPTAAALDAMFKRQFTPEHVEAMIDRPHPLAALIPEAGKTGSTFYRVLPPRDTLLSSAAVEAGCATAPLASGVAVDDAGKTEA